MAQGLGIYLHIPFCRQKCGYCDFASGPASEKDWDHYLTNLATEIKLRGSFLHHPQISTVFFGGGTPSLMGPERLNYLLNLIQENFTVDPHSEVTFEVNPETVDLADWKKYRQGGFNRASIGIQSLIDQELATCGRIHDADQARKAVAEASQAGFSRLSVDLMYGLPLQTLSSFEATLKEAISFPIDHISVYGLRIEEGTPFDWLHSQGQLSVPDEAVEDAMYDFIQDFLPTHGFSRYEISNVARLGGESQHNLKYWRYQPYLGLGAGACGFDGSCRINHPEDLAEYAKAISQLSQKDFLPDECPPLLERQAEFCFMGLRTLEGISRVEFQKRFGVSLENAHGKSLQKGMEQGWLKFDGERVYPTLEGLRFNNQLGMLFLP